MLNMLRINETFVYAPFVILTEALGYKMFDETYIFTVYPSCETILALYHVVKRWLRLSAYAKILLFFFFLKINQVARILMICNLLLTDA